MPTLDLNPAYLTMVKDLLRFYLPDAEIWAYGSRVNGTCHETSDLDLVVRNPNDLSRPCLKLSRVRSAFADSNIPILVDIRDWARIPQSFKEEIEKQFVAIQEPVTKTNPPIPI